jgi:guanine deaminase
MWLDNDVGRVLVNADFLDVVPGSADAATGQARFDYRPGAWMAIEHGRALAISSKEALVQRFGDVWSVDATIHSYPGCLIIPGMIDAHIHFPQLDIIASHGEGLLQWLERYTFPAEAAFADPVHAELKAGQFCDLLLAHGTTTAAVFGSVHRESVEALYRAAEARRMRLIAGKVLMDRNAPETVRDTVQQGYDDSLALIERWHGHDRLGYAITPRFAITSTPAQLEAAGALLLAQQGVYLQSHIGETEEEIATTLKLYPTCPTYADVYARYGLLGPLSLYGHGIYLTDAERQLMHESRSVTVHCPTSNFFLGSGLFDRGLACKPDRQQRLALGTDVGGGTSFSMLRTIAAADHVARLTGQPFSPAYGLYLATLGSAEALSLDQHIGQFSECRQHGPREADFVVLDPNAIPVLKNRIRRVGDIDELFHAIYMLGDERLVRETWVAGRRVYVRPEQGR